MQSLSTETTPVLRHPSVRSLSNEQLGQLTNGDSEELKQEYRELVERAQAQIKEIMGLEQWPIGGHVELTEDQMKNLEDPSRQWAPPSTS